MSKIFTVEQLVDNLDIKLAWRIKELATYKSMIRSGYSNSIQANCLLRGGIALLYAH